MSKKMMLLALSVVSAALFALPAVASATPAHINSADPFTVSKGATANSVLETTGGQKIECTNGVTGNGSWHSTTTGTLTLEFHGCTTETPFGHLACTTRASEGGTGISETISTTKLPFHLISLGNNKGGVLITPNESTGYFAHFTCGGGLVSRSVGGNGVIGTITMPECGTASTTATLKFEQEGTGLQKHTTHTGVEYHLQSPTGTKAAQVSEAQLHFPEANEIVCT